MAFGNAVERLVAADVRSSELSALILHVGGPGQPDFIGVGKAAGMTFDITTPLQVPSHLARPYGSGLQMLTYQLSADFKFP